MISERTQKRRDARRPLLYFTLLYFTLLYFTLLAPVNAYAQIDWELLTHPPCQTEDTTTWTGPHTFTFCNDHIGGFNIPACNDSCCFVIVYFDRWTGQNGNNYDINITGMFYLGDDGCGDCIDSSYLVILTHRVVHLISKDPTFKTRLLSSGDSIIYAYYRGKCLDTITTDECDALLHCCKFQIKLGFGGYGFPPHEATFTEVLYWQNRPFSPPCSTALCRNWCFYPSTGLDPRLWHGPCDPPCDYGNWIPTQSDEISILNINCLECKIIIHYSYRETPPCPTLPMRDFRLDYIEMQNCDGCIEGQWDQWGLYTQQEILFRFAQEWMIKHSPISDLEQGQSTEQYRTIHSPCWKLKWIQGHEYQVLPCYDEVCCWERLRVSRDKQDNYSYETIEDGRPNGVFCPFIPQESGTIYTGCQAVCKWTNIVLPPFFIVTN